MSVESRDTTQYPTQPEPTEPESLKAEPCDVPTRPAVILVRPREEGNVGSVARVVEGPAEGGWFHDSEGEVQELFSHQPGGLAAVRTSLARALLFLGEDQAALQQLRLARILQKNDPN